MQIISKIYLMKKGIIIERTCCKQTTCHQKSNILYSLSYTLLYIKKDFLLQISLLCLLSHETLTQYIIEYTDR